MLKTTKWKPDTCDCVLEYQWDDSEDEDVRTHDLNKILGICSHHTGLSNEDIYEHVKSENSTKNLFLKEALDRIPRIKKEKVNERGRVTETLDPAVSYEWRFIGEGKNRELIVSFDGANLTESEKDSLRSISMSKKVTVP